LCALSLRDGSDILSNPGNPFNVLVFGQDQGSPDATGSWFNVAFTAQKGARGIFFVASLTIGMVGLSQRRCGAGWVKSMTVRACLVLRRLICKPFAILVNMMAFLAFLDTCGLIVLIMLKNRRDSLGIGKYPVVNNGHILLGVGGRHDQKKQKEC